MSFVFGGFDLWTKDSSYPGSLCDSEINMEAT